MRKQPVTRRAALQRANRALRKDDLILRADRRGAYYLINFRFNALIKERVSLENAVEDLDVLEKWEKLEEE
jgi:hypothetical protein